MMSDRSDGLRFSMLLSPSSHSPAIKLFLVSVIVVSILSGGFQPEVQSCAIVVISLMKSGQSINSCGCLFHITIQLAGPRSPLSVIYTAFKCLTPHSFCDPQQSAHCQTVWDQARQCSLNYSHIRVCCAAGDACRSPMPAEIMLRGSGVPLIEAEMLLAGGKAEGFPGGGQHHCALRRHNEQSHRLAPCASSATSNRTLPQWQLPLDGHNSDIHVVHFQMGRHPLSHDKSLTDNIMTINPKTGLCETILLITVSSHLLEGAQ